MPAVWRFLEYLEECVGAEPIELVDRVDDRDPPSPLPGRRAEKRNRAAHVLHRNLLAQHALVVERALEHKKIALRLCRHPPRHWMLWSDGKRRCRAHFGRRRVRMREDEASHAVSQRRLADALLADEQEGVRNAAAAIGGEKRGLGVRVAEQHLGDARVRRFIEFARLRAHEAIVSKLIGASAGSSLAFTACQICLATIFLGSLASTMTHRSGSAAASAR